MSFTDLRGRSSQVRVPTDEKKQPFLKLYTHTKALKAGLEALRAERC